MRFLKRYKAYILACICIIAALCFAFFMGDDAPAPKLDSKTVADVTEEKPIAEGKTEKRAEAPPAPPLAEVQEEAAAQENAEKVQAEATIEEKTEDKAENALQCTLSVRCDTALGKAGEKSSVLPQDGVIFAGEGLAFSEGESVFDVLLREMQTHGIPLEFTKSPMYQSVYIEGIGNLYERDCGNQSGWIYKVNGEKPGYDCSNYILKPGDRIEWVYTCALGNDV